MVSTNIQFFEGNLGIQNSSPSHDFSVGSNLHVEDTGSNVLAVVGNVSVANTLILGNFAVVASHGLNHVTGENNTTTDTIILQNPTTGLQTTANILVGGNITATSGDLEVLGNTAITGNLHTTSNLETGGRLKFDANVFVDTLRVADVAANLVTYDQSTGELLDSAGLFSNRLAVVSKQPPSTLSANSTTVTNHGTYTLTTSNLATGSNTWNAFDGSTSVAWVGDDTYTGASNAYAGSVQLAGSTQQGEWLSLYLPYKTVLRHMKLTPSSVEAYPGSANLYASNDNSNWVELKHWEDVVPSSVSDTQTVVVNAPASYRRFAIVTTKVSGNNANVALSDWQLFAESFTVDGGKVIQAIPTLTGGETIFEQVSPHERTQVVQTYPKLKKYPDILLRGSDFQGHVVTSSSSAFSETHFGNFRAFNGRVDTDMGWMAGYGQALAWTTALYNGGGGLYSYTPAASIAGETGEWLKLKLPKKIILDHVKIIPRQESSGTHAPSTFKIFGSNDDSTWVELISETGVIPAYNYGSTYSPTSTLTTAYNYYVISVQKTVSDTELCIAELEYYGREETVINSITTTGDTSVDTVIKSVFNTPATTGLSLYLDGNQGSTATDLVSGSTLTVTENNSTYDDTDKSWVLDGSTESNIHSTAISLTTNVHSVSMWLNASNLHTNVETNSLFVIGTETPEGNTCSKISTTRNQLLAWKKPLSEDHVLTSNTWHHLVYAYGGEGKYKTAYLDGRQIGTEYIYKTERVREYPEFVMSAVIQEQHEVTRSSIHSASYQQWDAFDKLQYGGAANEGWITGPHYTNGQHNADRSSYGLGGVTGEWLKLKFPYRIRMESYDMIPRSSQVQRLPLNYTILGSNDDSTWDIVHQVSGQTASDLNVLGRKLMTGANKDNFYKYWGLVIQGIIETTTNQYTAIQELKYFGEREFDEFPNFEMNDYEEGGFRVSGEGREYNENGYPIWNVFRRDDLQWITADNDGYPNNDGVYSQSNTSGVRLASNTDYGKYMKLKCPRQFVLKNMTLRDHDSYYIKDFKIYGSNDDINWTEVLSVTGRTASGLTFGSNHDADTTTKAYNMFAMVISKVNGGTTARIQISQIRFFGTPVSEVLHLPATPEVRVGGSFDGKIANFRVYDKYLQPEEVEELWDAQKHQFGLAKSSVTFYKGRVGIGTTEPKGALTVADETIDFRGTGVFPPGPMDSESTKIPGHGIFKASGGDYYGSGFPTEIQGADQRYAPWQLFQYTTDHEDGDNQNGAASDAYWHGKLTYDSTPPYAAKTTIANDQISPKTFGIPGVGMSYGNWVDLHCPYKVRVNEIEIARVSSAKDSLPGAGYLLGSNDQGETWEIIHTFSGWTESDFDFGRYYATFHFPLGEVGYKTIRLHVTHLTGDGEYIRISGLRYRGVAVPTEKGHSTLHDGELLLTKSLNVPRFGPPLGSNKVPSRDTLLVEYDTSIPIHGRLVDYCATDTSGNGLNARMYNEMVFDNADMSFRFISENDFMQVNLNSLYTSHMPRHIVRGNFQHTMSVWFYVEEFSPDPCIFHLGPAGVTDGKSSLIQIDNTNQLVWYLGDGYMRFPHGFQMHRWYHMVAVYNGDTGTDGRRVWIDGKELFTDYITNVLFETPLDMTDMNLHFGRQIDGTNDYYGKMSSIRMYRSALNEGEVKQLYDLGRKGTGNQVNFEHTAVAIGSHQPRALLDVAGSVRAQANFQDTFTGQHFCVPEGPMGEGLVVSANKNQYIKMNGGLSTGSDGITIDESLPVVSLSGVSQDKSCFGVVSKIEKSGNSRIENLGGLISETPKVRGDNRVVVNSLGEGALWVINTGGPLESGDYVTTSNVVGYGEKQSGEFLANYTVAKVTMDCDFTGSNVAVRAPKKVETLTTVTEDVWSNLTAYNRSSTTETQYINEENVVLDEEHWSKLTTEEQNTYSDTTLTTYYQIKRGRNLLDEKGSIQWEDTDRMKPGYKVRYLDASGVETDQANVVYTAAFMGCTYHCG